MAKILYFAGLADVLDRTSETAQLPPDVANVRALLACLRARGGVWTGALADGAVRVTVNKQFANLDTKLGADDEIAIVPLRPARDG